MSPSPTRPGSPADLVLRGGRVWTGDPGRPSAEAVAVADGRIIAVGEAAEADGWIGPRTRVVELRDRLLVPGFVDAHVHVASSGLNRFLCDIHDVRGADASIAAVVAWADAHPDAAWVHGGGWTMSDFPGGFPHRTLLDAVLPDRPVYLFSRDGHDGWANGRALELAGIDETTPDPPNGGIQRDADGRPTGVLHESGVALVERVVPPATAAQVEDGIIGAQAWLHTLGITGWQDAHLDEDVQAAYDALAGRGGLTARVTGAMGWDLLRGTEQLAGLLARRERSAAAGFDASSVKVFADGIIENRTASLLDPYLGPDGRPTDHRGDRMIDPAAFAAAATAIDAAGLQLHVHVIGDRATRDALDAVAAARHANGPSDTRPHLAHIQVIHPADRPRFAALGVAANAQPYWAVHEATQEELNLPVLGPERSAWQYPFASLLRAGAHLAMGSDWSVSTPNPLLEIEVAVTRISDETRDREPFYPEERLTLDEALRAFTFGSAWLNHREAETGTIEVGKLADLAVVDRDLFAPDAGPIGAARVIGTFVGGRIVHEAPELG